MQLYFWVPCSEKRHLKTPAAWEKLSKAEDSRSILVTSVEDHERIWLAEEVFLVQLVGTELQGSAVLQGHIKRCRSVWEVDTISRGWRGTMCFASALLCSFLLAWGEGAGPCVTLKEDAAWAADDQLRMSLKSTQMRRRDTGLLLFLCWTGYLSQNDWRTIVP